MKDILEMDLEIVHIIYCYLFNVRGIIFKHMTHQNLIETCLRYEHFVKMIRTL